MDAPEKRPLVSPYAWLAGLWLAGRDGLAVPVGAMAVVPVQREEGLDGA